MVEPIQVEAYKCPVCEGIIVGTKEKAIEHTNILPDKPLPPGLVYRDNPSPNPIGDIYVIDGTGTMSTGGLRGEVVCGGTHTLDYSVRVHSFFSGEVLKVISENSREFRSRLRNSMYALLTPEEFTELMQRGGQVIERERALTLLRTTPELELLIAQHKRD